MLRDKAKLEQGSNLARECREFYERRVVMAESASRHWQAVESDKTYSTIRRNKAGTISRPRTNDEENEPFVRLPLKIAQLRRELLSLVNLDNQLFKHLLTLNDTIEDLRDRSNPKIIPIDVIVDKPVKQMIPERLEETEETEAENFEWPLSFEEAQMFASLPVAQPGFNNYTKTLPNATRRRRMADQDETSGAMKFVLRSKSFLLRQPFQRKQLSFPASRQNRRKGFEPTSLEEEQENDNNNGGSTATLNRKISAQDLHLPFSSLNLGSSTSNVSRGSGSGLTGSSAPSQHLFHLPPSRFLWQKMFFSNSQSNGPESLPSNWYGNEETRFTGPAFNGKSPNHIKQNSFDSGIHTSDGSEYSVKV